MKRFLVLSFACLFGAFSAGDGFAQNTAPQKAVSAQEQRAAIAALALKLDKNYVFPEVAKTVAAALKSKHASGGYAEANTTDAFADALTRDLHDLARDKHFRVRYDPEFRERSEIDPALPSKEEVADAREEAARDGFGITKVERLPGNVGYMEITGFWPTDLIGEQYTAAIALLLGSDAMILDLRRNGGGEPNSVAHLLSHFFPIADERHLNDIYYRPENTTRQFWTNQAVPVRYTHPVYVLTSSNTFSGGEECAYDFQTQKRATLVGEVTGGGANPVAPFALASGFMAAIPTGKAINPITKSNWEHVGVQPDIAVPAAQALQTAYLAILRGLIQDTKDPERLSEFKDALEKAQRKRTL